MKTYYVQTKTKQTSLNAGYYRTASPSSTCSRLGSFRALYMTQIGY